MGIISALFVILLSVSGLVLHYSPALSLDNQYIDSSLLLGWYRMEVPDITQSFADSDHRVSLIADTLYFDVASLPGNFYDLKGLVSSDFGYIVATSNQLVLLTGAGELVEILASAHGLPDGIQRIGSSANGQLYLQIPVGLVEADVDALNWVRSNIAESLIQWSAPSAADQLLVSQIHADYAAALISWERLILDVHSGRVLGGVGVLLVDIMALLFIFMAATGVWIWSRRRS